MRQAAQGNVDAALEAINKVRAGGSYRGLRSRVLSPPLRDAGIAACSWSWIASAMRVSMPSCATVRPS